MHKEYHSWHSPILGMTYACGDLRTIMVHHCYFSRLPLPIAKNMNVSV